MENTNFKYSKYWKPSAIGRPLSWGTNQILETKEYYESFIGCKVQKKSKSGTEPKPFKSGLKINTVKGIMNHPQLNIPAFTFEEDESYVECRRCVKIS